MLCCIIFLFISNKVLADNMFINSPSGLVVDNLSAYTFLDNNGYIRLNISWENKKYDSDYVSIYFNNNEECNPISDVEMYPLNRHFIIAPNMELEHPADHLIHGCNYNITLRDKGANKSQSLIYKVPECVENKCQCKDSAQSPNTLTKIESLSDELFMVAWNKTTDANLTVHYIYYQRKDEENSIRTYIPEKSFHYVNNAVEIPLHEIKNDITYTVTLVFIDEFNECIYFSSIDYISHTELRSGKYTTLFTISGISVLLILLLLYIITRCSLSLNRRLKKYVTYFSKSYNEYENQDASTPLSQFKIREEFNAQYTPLEFVLKMHKYDEYEFPRNKIIIKETIGEGAFGRVYYAKAYEINRNPGFTIVAVKQLKEGASEEDVMDFHAEIETFKKIGRHENIVTLLGCVTIEKPYMMIMELVPCGSLKKYLLKLRKTWTERKNIRKFFPDDMDENWFKINTEKPNNGHINYIKCIFDNNECSYIIPDCQIPNIPVTCDSSFLKEPVTTNYETNNFSSSTLLESIGTSAQVPITPSSMTSSPLPSSIETDLTTLDSELNTPAIGEVNRALEPVLDHTELQKFAFQIANGMAWLEKIPITHRDLAARNILITSDKILKISDYGMSRPGPYVNRKSKKVPLRWMAIESIEDQKWDSKSDVWSFGVVLWEIGTLGAFPYEDTPDVFILPELKKGKRLDRPRICTNELYALMLQCWSENPEKRPSFSELIELLDVKKQKVYVDFNQLSPKYTFPPTKHLNAVDENEI